MNVKGKVLFECLQLMHYGIYISMTKHVGWAK